MKDHYVLGRKEQGSIGAISIGRYYALDSSLGTEVHIDVLHPHIVLICGKRGYGKSYTLGVFLEEIARLDQEIRKNLAVVVIDTLGIFWTTSFPNTNAVDQLKKWNLEPEGTIITLLVPKKHIDEYRKQGITAQPFSLNVSELSLSHWYQLFNIEATDPFGIVLTRALLYLKSQRTDFSIQEILEYIRNDQRADTVVKAAAENFLAMADAWGIFDREGLHVTDIVKRDTISILDLSHITDPVLKDSVLSLLSKRIFEERVKARKRYEQKRRGATIEETGIPMVWLALDEAQLFLPKETHMSSKDVLINEWMRQGRQPGLSLLMATQRPNALEPEVLSHSDIVICHRLTAQADIEALSSIRPTYLHGDIKESIKKIGGEKGVAFILDDNSESTHVIKIRPRLSWHGGAESLACLQPNMMKEHSVVMKCKE